MATVNHQTLANLLTSDVPVPAWWTSRLDQIQDFLDAEVDPQNLRTLATSPGGRPVRGAFYGPGEPHLRGAANFNSALGGQNPDAYYRRTERKQPVLVILAGAHGQEVEGMIGALSAISIVETGMDLMGREQPALADKLRRLRLIVIPLANPDGRARVPYDGWVGLPGDEMHRAGQGTRRDGTNYGWPGCKIVHPMNGDVMNLGGYFNDEGVNLMHDEWSAPMSETTRALLKLVADEGPDMVLNCHSHGAPPSVLSIAYAPMAVKEQLAAFAQSYYERLRLASLPHGPVPQVKVDGSAGTMPPAMNLTAFLYHVGAALPMTFETPHGLSTRPEGYTYEQLLQIHHNLYEAASDWLLNTKAR